MQEDDIEQKHAAASQASRSRDKAMSDKRENAQRMAEQLIAEENRDERQTAVKTYFVAAIIGLVLWAAIYFIWRSF
jgi:hypothetical protein